MFGYFYDDELIRYDSNPNFFSSYLESNLYICPYCLNYVVLSRNSPSEDYINETSIFCDVSSDNCNDKFRISNKKSFKSHIKRCKKKYIFDGIHKVPFTIPMWSGKEIKHLIEIAVRMAYISHMETEYLLQLSIQTLRYQYNPVSYILFHDIRPIAFILCFPKIIDKVNMLSIANIYTIPKYRKRGFQTKLLDHLIEQEKIKKLLISIPLSEDGEIFIKNYLMRRQIDQIILDYTSKGKTGVSEDIKTIDFLNQKLS